MQSSAGSTCIVMDARWFRIQAVAVRRLTAGILMANAPFWVLNYLILIDRPLITYESVLVCLVLTWCRWLGVVLPPASE